MQYPSEVVRMLAAGFVLWAGSKTKKWTLCLVLGLVVVGLLGYGQHIDKAGLFNLLSDKTLGNQVTQKFLDEDDVTERIVLPLWFRRLSYNKPSMLGRSVIKELQKFWNIEVIFFQEISPDGNKALIALFWPLIIPFLFGLYIFLNSKNINEKKLLNYWFLLSYWYFLTSSSKENYRWLLMIWWVGYVTAIGWRQIYKVKPVGIVLAGLWFYGWQSFDYDFRKRPDYWLNNRPLVYQYIFHNISNLGLKKEIYITDKVGEAERYCRYYWGSKCGTGMKFGSFDLRKGAVSDEIYAGFVGEFLGPDANNVFNDEVKNIIESKGFTVLGMKKLRDSIAFSYGDTIVIAQKE